MPTRQTSSHKNLRDRLLDHFAVLRIPITPEQFDAVIARAEREHLAHLDFLEALIAEQANQRRERGIQHRIREARFREPRNLETFDWKFNAPTIDRVQIEELATSDFIRRKDNLVMVGQSGVGKSHILQSLGRRACALGYRVRYTTSAALLKDLTASLADQTLPQRLRYYKRFDLLIIDEFGCAPRGAKTPCRARDPTRGRCSDREKLRAGDAQACARSRQAALTM